MWASSKKKEFDKLSAHEVIPGFHQLERIPKGGASEGNAEQEEKGGIGATSTGAAETRTRTTDIGISERSGGIPWAPSSTRSAPGARGFHDLEPMPDGKGGYVERPGRRIDVNSNSTYTLSRDEFSRNYPGSVGRWSTLTSFFGKRLQTDDFDNAPLSGSIGELPSARLKELKESGGLKLAQLEKEALHNEREIIEAYDESSVLVRTQDSLSTRVSSRTRPSSIGDEGFGYKTEDCSMLNDEIGEGSPLNNASLIATGEIQGRGWDSEGEEPESLGIYVRDWSPLAGESREIHASRLYISNLNPAWGHDVNCERLLREVLDYFAAQELGMLGSDLKLRHIIKIETFLRLVVLSLPARTWRQNVQNLISPRGVAARRREAEDQPQIAQQKLIELITFFFKVVDSMKSSPGGEDDSALDGERVDIILKAYVATAMEVLPLARPTHTLLPSLLNCTACDVLDVRQLSSEIRLAVTGVIQTFGERSKMMNSTSQNADKFLRPVCLEFIAWLRENRSGLQQACATEAVLRSIDPELRTKLREQVYTSPEHFLSVFESYSHRLMGVELPAGSPQLDEVANFSQVQTKKDVSRELFLLNGVQVPSKDLFGALSELIETANGVHGAGLGEGRKVEKEHAEECVWRILHSASRTAGGGDAFFVVQDLFGGEGVIIKASLQKAPPIEISNKGLSFSVCMMQSYDVYNMSDVSEGLAFPLMTLNTEVKEVVIFSALPEESPKANKKHRLRELSSVLGNSLPLDGCSGRYLTIKAEPPKFQAQTADALQDVPDRVTLERAVSQFSSAYLSPLDDRDVDLFHTARDEAGMAEEQEQGQEGN